MNATVSIFVQNSKYEEFLTLIFPMKEFSKSEFSSCPATPKLLKVP